MGLTYGVVVLGRSTFDVPFAEEQASLAFDALETAGVRTVGVRTIAFDAPAAELALAAATGAGKIDLLLVLQTTFTDATMTVALAQRAREPFAIWALPEPRLGGRLRLNAYCGLNLAAHALGKAGKPFNWLYVRPQDASSDRLRALAAPPVLAPSAAAPPAGAIDGPKADALLKALQGARFAVVGDHPAGFHTCEHDPALLGALGGFEVERIELDDLFARAKAAPAEAVAAARAKAGDLEGLAEVDQDQLERSFRVFCALGEVKRATGARGLAVRCWPEMFTEYGCAACGPMAMMNAEMTPSACEADVHGSLSQLMLQELAGEPAWMADLVDIGGPDDTAVLWHCGLAPLSMRDPEAPAEAQIHTNRRMPLLHQFPLKPGRVTLARLSQARGGLMLVIASAEVLRRPRAFTGNSGVVRFDRPAETVSERIIEQGLEHHYALAYGDHRPALRGVAERWGLAVLELA
jgi:L-fucose isomerase-like protein